jgi:hypothetical protein
MDFECHVTVSCETHRIKELQELIESVGWSFSKIDGDPVLGPHVFCYATNHYDELAKAIGDTYAMSLALRLSFFDVPRRKIEQIMLDERNVNGHWLESQQIL